MAREFAAQVERFAAALQALGLRKGDRVAVFSEGNARWMVADQGIMAAGGIPAVSCSSLCACGWGPAREGRAADAGLVRISPMPTGIRLLVGARH